MKKEDNILAIFLKSLLKKIKLLNNHSHSLNEKIFLSYITLILISVIFMYGTSVPISEKIYKQKHYIYYKHIIHVIISIAFIGLFYKIPIRLFFKFSSSIFIFLIIILVLTLIPNIGKEVKGVYRWIDVYFFSIQASEWTKIFIHFFLSHLIIKKQKYFNISDKKGPLPILFIIYLCTFLILIEYDFSNSIILLLSLMSLCYIAGFPIKYFIYPITAMPLIYLFIYSFDYMRIRLSIYIKKFLHPEFIPYQEKQAYKAIVNAPFINNEISIKSYYSNIPEAHTDFYFINIIADLGILGAVLILCFYFYFYYLIFSLANTIKNLKYAFFIHGINFVFIWQAIFNLGSILGLFPITGIPLPFLSFGGNAMLTSSIGLAFILQIASQEKKLKNQLQL